MTLKKSTQDIIPVKELSPIRVDDQKKKSPFGPSNQHKRGGSSILEIKDES
jgi:hypothetical protein